MGRLGGSWTISGQLSGRPYVIDLGHSATKFDVSATSRCRPTCVENVSRDVVQDVRITSKLRPLRILDAMQDVQAALTHIFLPQ